MDYVDGFIVPVPKRKLGAYKALARMCAKIWREYGAIDYKECVADGLKWGKHTSFPRSVKLKQGEVVVFSYIVYKSRRHKDAVMKKVLADRRFADMDPAKMPFDAKRMIHGGFKTMVSF